MLNLLVLAYGLLAAYVGQKAMTYFLSAREARRFAAASPIPSVSIYSPRDSTLFWIFSPWLAAIIESLPFNWGHWMLYAKKDFNWLSRGKLPLEELGSDTYWTAGPGGVALWSSDADVVCQVVHRWKDFPKSAGDYVALAVFGPNVVTTEGADWQRHRKITAPPFNEKNSGLVFHQTTIQTKKMLDSFIQDADGKKSAPGHEPVVKDLIHWTMTLTLNVIAGASFNIKAAWPTTSVAAESKQSHPSSEEGESDMSSSDEKSLPFHNSLTLVMNNIRILIGVPQVILRNSPLRYLTRASDHFQSYTREMIAAHRDEKSNENNAGDLLGSIVKNSSRDNGVGLSEQEMIGNIYIFMVAGHETSASTLKTALVLLASHPQIQMQVQKEIDGIWATKKAGEELSYDDYPKMRIIMALMLEVLRFYPPVVFLPKFSSNSIQTITHEGKTIQIPPMSRVNLDIVGVQRNPKYWGSDAQEFRLSRWLMPEDYKPPPDSSNESLAHPNLLCPRKGAFLAFNSGFRGCLGRKFAQVEFCTLVAVVLKDHSIELVSENGAAWDEMRKKALDAVEDRETGLAMRLRNNVKVRFVRRGAESFPAR
ncbi:Cytochrome P450, partial [Lachnellula willkommii]